jgi:hypothetical protein
VRHVVVVLWFAVTTPFGASTLSGQTPSRSAESAKVERPAGAEATPEVDVSTSVSQTALWPGDRVDFTVELTCAPNIGVLDDDLSQDKLKLEGLEAIGAETERLGESRGTTRIRVRYHLTTYEVGTPTVRIGDWTVRYYAQRPGQRPEDAVPAGEIKIPGAVLPLRSTLPGDLQSLDVRAGRSFEPTPAALQVAYVAGIGLLIVSAAPVGLWIVSLARKAGRPRPRRRTQAVRNETREALEELRSMGRTTPLERREGFARLDQIVRRHLAQLANMPALALTPDEVTERLRANDRLPAGPIGDVLTDCEQARYAPLDRVPTAECLRTAVETTEQLLLGSHR